MDKLTELKAKYGEAMIKLEIIQSQVQAVKQELVAEMNKQNGKMPEKKEYAEKKEK